MAIHTGRYLGATEQFFWLSDQLEPKHFSLVAEIEGPTTAEGWRTAFDLLQTRHPLLQVRIVQDGDETPRFEYVPEARISLDIVSDTGESRWEEHVVAEFKRPFPFGTGPLIRARLLHTPNRTILVLVVHHAIADGLSSAYLVRDLLKALSGQPLPPLSLPQAQENYLSTEVVTPAASTPDDDRTTSPWPPARSQDTTATTLSVQSLKLSKALTDLLRSKSRKEGTTVHGTLIAALTLAGHQLSDHWSRLPARVVSPVNNRLLLGLEDDCVASIVFPIGVYKTDSLAEFWNTARKVTQDIAPARTREGVTYAFEAMTGLIQSRRTPEAIVEFERVVVANEMMVSNLGVLPFESQFGEMRLTSLWGPAVLIGIEGEQIIGVSTVNDQIHLLRTSYSPIAGLLDRAASILRSVVEEQ